MLAFSVDVLVVAYGDEVLVGVRLIKLPDAPEIPILAVVLEKAALVEP